MPNRSDLPDSTRVESNMEAQWELLEKSMEALHILSNGQTESLRKVMKEHEARLGSMERWLDGIEDISRFLDIGCYGRVSRWNWKEVVSKKWEKQHDSWCQCNSIWVRGIEASSGRRQNIRRQDSFVWV